MPTTQTTDFEGFELHDAAIDRVDLVGKAANGRTFLLMKSEDSNTLVTKQVVSDLIKQAEGANMTSSTAAPKADANKTAPATEPVTKDEDLDVTEPLADAPAGTPAIGEGTPGSPAWEAVDAATAEKWVAVLARAKNALDLLASREIQEVVTGGGDMDDEFNSWDLEDAAQSIDWAISLLGGYAAREKAEVGIAEDMESLGKAESDGRWESLQKALAGIDIPAFAEAMSNVERLGTLQKSGRVLSSTNEGLIQTAADSLQKVLSSVQVAAEVTDGGEIVKDEATEEPAEVTKDEKPAAEPEPVAKAETVPPADPERTPVEKAIAGEPLSMDEFDALTKEELDQIREGREAAKVEKADDTDPAAGNGELQIVYDANGSVVGVVDPAEVKPVKGAPAAADDPAAPATDPAAAPAAADPAAAPAVAKSTKTETEQQGLIAKSEVDQLVKAGVEAALVQSDAAIAELTKQVAWLMEPAKSKVATNGAAMMAPRGQSEASSAASGIEGVTKSTGEIRKELDQAGTPAEREAIAKQLQDQAERQWANARSHGLPQ